MKKYEDMPAHPITEKLVEILCRVTRTENTSFFNVMVAYYLTVVASTMRAKIRTVEKDVLPINTYAIGLMPSGMGKGRSTKLMEKQVINQFMDKFKYHTLPLLEMKNIPALAGRRALRKASDPDKELEKANFEYGSTGELAFFISKGTEAALRQARHKLLMVDAGSLNLQIDEIGKNLLGAQETLDMFLELYDNGSIKPSLTKNTKENLRYEEIIGETPTNMILFGAPCAVMDGGRNQDLMFDMMETGMARRCFMAFAKASARRKKQTPQERLLEITSHTKDTFLEDLSDKLAILADAAYLDQVISIEDPVGLIFIEYQIQNEEAAEELAEHDELRRLELMHRHFKAMKMAGAFAFIDSSPEVTEDHAYYAIRLAEESGKAFDAMLTKDQPHIKLAKYLADTPRAVTQSDLVGDLPFYKGPINLKQDMMQLAIAYGYRNSILIKRTYSDEVEFITGETLKATDLDAIKVSYSDEMAANYRHETARFNQLHTLTQIPGKQWCSHAFRDNYRLEENAIPGFNLLVLDVDKDVSLSTAKLLLKGYKALFYTTKRHQTTDRKTGEVYGDRFRVLIPTNYELKLNAEDHKEFWQNIFDWLPFEVDHASETRSRKWESFPGIFEYVDGEKLDVLPFIPKTTKNQKFKDKIFDQSNMDNLERWMVNNAGTGARNNILFRYAMVLLDAGFDFAGINSRVCGLNAKTPEPLDEAEILSTIMVKVTKALAHK